MRSIFSLDRIYKDQDPNTWASLLLTELSKSIPLAKFTSYPSTTMAHMVDKNEMSADKAIAVSSDGSVSAGPDANESVQRVAGKLDVLTQGVALFSDGYNIQIIGYMNTVLTKLYVVNLFLFVS